MSFFKKPAPAPVEAPVATSPQVDATTVISLLGVAVVLGSAIRVSFNVLPPSIGAKKRVLFVWHLFDALIHFIFEGLYLWNCFFVAYALPTSFSAANRNGPKITYFTPPDVYWLGRTDLLYGASYGETPLSKLWQEYAKADKRWGGVDLTIVSLEILTVFVAGPLALWISYMLTLKEEKGFLKKWFWMTILATGEIYGGWMTFAPEWLTGSPNLETSNWIYLWLYLVFFNGLWVIFPAWILYEAYQAMTSAMTHAEMVDLVYLLNKDE